MDHKYVSVVFLLSWMFCIGDISGENPSVIHTCYVVVLVAVVFLLVFFFFFLVLVVAVFNAIIAACL